MIIFLDFDGVLHPINRSEPDFCRAPLLWKILRALPTAEVVLSTSWREIYHHDEMIEFVTRGGGEDLVNRIIGATPERLVEEGAYIHGEYYRRHIECKLWLIGNNQQNRPWLAIDDIARWFPPNSPNLHVTNANIGLTENDVEQIIAKLRTEPSIFGLPLC